MLLIGSIVACAIALYMGFRLIGFWKYNRSIAALERVGEAIVVRACRLEEAEGPDAAQYAFEVAICLKGVADVLTYGRVRHPEVVNEQLAALNDLLISPDDFALIMERPVSDTRRVYGDLLRARDSFLVMLRMRGQSPG